LSSPSIAIIGAGIAGLTLATLLSKHANVLVVDKARGVGGRMASRRVGDASVDHGAQFFTARSDAFRHFLQPWLAASVIKVWTPRVLTLEAGAKPYRRDWFEAHYIGVPAMTTLPKALAAGLTLRLQYEVTRVQREGERWWLHAADGTTEGPFDWVVATAPAPQITGWFPPDFSGMAALQAVRYSPCFALMLAYADLPVLRFDAARVKSSPLDWIVRNNSVAGQSQQLMLLHSTRVWAQEHLDTNSDSTIAQLLQALDNVLEQRLPLPVMQQLHRWRYASATHTTSAAFELDIDKRLAACGDWSMFSDVDHGGARVESAFLSAHALASRLLALPGFH
jgi:renalase